jgi:hypothetical protein
MSTPVEGRIGSAPQSHLIASASPVPLHAGAGVGNGHDNAHSLETLDEPVSTTIMRDLRRVAIKLKHVLIPSDTAKELRDCQWWMDDNIKHSGRACSQPKP